MFDFLCYESGEKYLPKQGPVSHVRFINASPTCKRVDIYSNGHLIGKNIGFKKLTPYLTVPSGQHNINIYPAGKKTNLITYKNMVIEEGSIYTIILYGTTKADIFLVPDLKISKEPGSANLRFVNLSPENPLDITLQDESIIFSSCLYKSISKYISLPPGKYTFRIKHTESLKTVIAVPDETLKEEWNYTIYTFGFVDGKPGLNVLILLDGNTYINT